MRLNESFAGRLQGGGPETGYAREEGPRMDPRAPLENDPRGPTGDGLHKARGIGARWELKICRAALEATTNMARRGTGGRGENLEF